MNAHISHGNYKFSNCANVVCECITENLKRNVWALKHTVITSRFPWPPFVYLNTAPSERNLQLSIQNI